MILILWKEKHLEANFASNVKHSLVNNISNLDFEHYHAQYSQPLLFS